MKTISVIGLGNRGTEYMGFLKSFHSKKVSLHSLCDIRQQALDDIAPKFGIPKERQYLSTKDFENASMNWIAEGVNFCGQGLFLLGTCMLHKAGLADLKLEKDI